MKIIAWGDLFIHFIFFRWPCVKWLDAKDCKSSCDGWTNIYYQGTDVGKCAINKA